MPRPFPRSRLRRLAAVAGLGCLALTGVTGLSGLGSSATGAVYTSSLDAGTSTFTTRAACSAGTSYPAAVVALGPTFYYRFGEAAAPYPGSVADSSGNGNDGTVVAGSPASTSLTFGAPSPIWCDGTGAISQAPIDQAASTAGFVVWPTLRTHPDVFTLMAWVQTAPGMSTGGQVMGFGDSLAARSSMYDRHIYLDNAGHVVFGIWTGSPTVLTSPGVVNDGKPHQLVASLGPAGGRLYVDGALVASDPSWTVGQTYDGYWRVGWDSLGAWGTGTDPADYGMDGTIDEAAVFDGKELTPGEVAGTYATNHW
jgi:hypothetical protein